MWGPPLAAALLVLNDGGLGVVFDASVTAIWPSVQLAVVVEVILTAEPTLSTKFAVKVFGTFAMEPLTFLIVMLQMRRFDC